MERTRSKRVKKKCRPLILNKHKIIASQNAHARDATPQYNLEKLQKQLRSIQRHIQKYNIPPPEDEDMKYHASFVECDVEIIEPYTARSTGNGSSFIVKSKEDIIDQTASCLTSNITSYNTLNTQRKPKHKPQSKRRSAKIARDARAKKRALQSNDKNLQKQVSNVQNNMNSNNVYTDDQVVIINNEEKKTDFTARCTINNITLANNINSDTNSHAVFIESEEETTDATARCSSNNSILYSINSDTNFHAVFIRDDQETTDLIVGCSNNDITLYDNITSDTYYHSTSFEGEEITDPIATCSNNITSYNTLNTNTNSHLLDKKSEEETTRCQHKRKHKVRPSRRRSRRRMAKHARDARDRNRALRELQKQISNVPSNIDTNNGDTDLCEEKNSDSTAQCSSNNVILDNIT